jgi:hypothetical protein
MRTLFLVLWLVLPVGVASAQTFGEITGEVTDQSGAIAPDASVTATNTATNGARTTRTNQAGVYSFPALVPGPYQVKVEAAGFQSAVRSNIELQVQQTARVDFTLTVGQTSQTVEVSGTALLLTTESATVGTVIEQKSIVELPLNGRDFLQLVALSPSVTYGFAPPNQAVGRQGGTRATENIAIAGMRGTWNNYTLDGVANTDVNFNLYIQLPSIDALQEFKVQTGIYPAEFGREASQINVSTKSGTNTYHGTVFEFLRNSKLDAKPYDFIGTDPAKAPFRWNQYGFTLAGPIQIPKLFNGKDRLFFMSNFEGFKSRRTDQGLYTTAPDSWRHGDFSSFTTLYDPNTRVTSNGVTTALPFANNKIDQSRWDQTSLKLMEFWPLPNLKTPTVSNNFQTPQKTTIDKNQFNQRIDFNQSANSQWFGRYGWTDEFTIQPQLPLSGTTIYTNSRQYMISNTRVLSPTKVNEFRFGYITLTNNSAQELAGKRDVVKELGLPFSTPDPQSWGIPAVAGLNQGLSTFGNNSNGPFLLNDKIVQGLDNFSWVHGKHSLRFGGEYRWDVYNNSGNQFSRGQFTFAGLYTGNPAKNLEGGNSAADLLLGTFTRTDLAIGIAAGDFKANSLASYIDDTYKLTPKLTVTLGMRWEVVQPWKDGLQNSVNYQFKTGLPAAVNVDPSLHPVYVRTGTGDFYQGLDFRYTGVQTARDGRLGDRLVDTDWNLFAPRIGIAYSPSSKWSFRTGFGIFYSQESANSKFDLNRGSSGRASQVPAVGGRPTVTYNNFFSSAVLPVILPAGLTWGVTPNIGTPYTMMYLFNIQRQLGSSSTLEIGYNGDLHRHLQNQNNGAGLLPYNAPGVPPGINVAPALRAPYPEFPAGIELTESGGRGNYNGLSVKLSQRFKAGLTTLVSYTWSKALDDGSAIRGNAVTGVANGDMYPENPLCRQCEKGPSAFNTPARLVTSILYELPLGKGKSLLNRGGFLNELVGGWQTSTIFTASSGRPLYPIAGWDAAGQIIQGNWDRLNSTGIDPYLPSDKRSANQWFNTAGFSNLIPGQYGNMGRYSLTGPGVWNLDFSAIKNFPIKERQSLQLRFETFNILNHPALAGPNMNWGGSSPTPAPSFGQIRDIVTAAGFVRGTAYDMRQLQFALKYIF